MGIFGLRSNTATKLDELRLPELSRSSLSQGQMVALMISRLAQMEIFGLLTVADAPVASSGGSLPLGILLCSSFPVTFWIQSELPLDLMGICGLPVGAQTLESRALHPPGTSHRSPSQSHPP